MTTVISVFGTFVTLILSIGAMFGAMNTMYAAVAYRTLLPEVDQMIEYVRVILRLLTGIVLGMAAIGVMNTLLMSVMERTRVADMLEQLEAI